MFISVLLNISTHQQRETDLPRTITERQNQTSSYTLQWEENVPPLGGGKGTDPEWEELKYNMFIHQGFSGRRKAQLYHPVMGTALHASVVGGEGSVAGMAAG